MRIQQIYLPECVAWSDMRDDALTALGGHSHRKVSFQDQEQKRVHITDSQNHVASLKLEKVSFRSEHGTVCIRQISCKANRRQGVAKNLGHPLSNKKHDLLVNYELDSREPLLRENKNVP